MRYPSLAVECIPPLRRRQSRSEFTRLARNLQSAALGDAHGEFFFLNTFLAIATIALFGLGFPFVADLFRSFESANPNPSNGGLYVLLVVWAGCLGRPRFSVVALLAGP
jgi:hypothetical protein